MAMWLKKFFSLCIRTSRRAAAVLEVDLCVIVRGRYGQTKTVYQPSPVRAEDTRPRLRVVITYSEGPPAGMLRILDLLPKPMTSQTRGLDY